MKVSVVMVTYGHGKYIKEAIEGVLMQVCDFEVELIVANDKSPDNTEVVVTDIIKNHPNGHLIKYTRHEDNKGMIPNFMWSLEQCKGKYIALCDGDDYWIDPLKLQKQVEFMEENPDFSFSMGRVDILIDSTGEIKKRTEIVNPLKREYLTLKDYLKGPISQTSSFVFRNDNKPLPEWIKNVHAGDQSLVVIKTGVGGKIKYHEECLSIYRINEKSISFKPGYNVYLKSIQTLAIWNEYTNFNFSKVIRFRSFKQRLMADIISIKNLFIRRLFMRLVKDIYFILIKLY